MLLFVIGVMVIGVKRSLTKPLGSCAITLRPSQTTWDKKYSFILFAQDSWHIQVAAHLSFLKFAREHKSLREDVKSLRVNTKKKKHCKVAQKVFKGTQKSLQGNAKFTKKRNIIAFARKYAIAKK